MQRKNERIMVGPLSAIKTVQSAAIGSALRKQTTRRCFDAASDKNKFLSAVKFSAGCTEENTDLRFVNKKRRKSVYF